MWVILSMLIVGALIGARVANRFSAVVLATVLAALLHAAAVELVGTLESTPRGRRLAEIVDATNHGGRANLPTLILAAAVGAVSASVLLNSEPKPRPWDPDKPIPKKRRRRLLKALGKDRRRALADVG
jgi:hypothetical protein